MDVCPEYTGTIVREIRKGEGNPARSELNQWLTLRGMKVAVPLGFNNTYAMALRETQAAKLGLKTISDLARQPAGALKLGPSHEFQVRADGWPGLRPAYGLALVPGADAWRGAGPWLGL